MNVVVLEGTLSSAVVARSLPSGTTLYSLEVTTRSPDGEAASVPVEWFDPVRPPDWPPGTEVMVLGSVRRRFFRVGATRQSRTAVVAIAVARTGDRRGIARLRRLLTSSLPSPPP